MQMSLLTRLFEPFKVLFPEILVGWSMQTLYVVGLSGIERRWWITLCRRLANRDELRALI